MREFERISKVRPLMQSLYRSAKENLSFKPDATIVILEDGDNAANPLGKTAYYDPANHKISLYTQGRHVKDVMRSLAHELVHHAQNCRGQMAGGIATVDGYAQEDGHLREMEREAYETGNLIFRDWEDGIKYKSNNGSLFSVGVSTGEKLMNETKVSKSVLNTLRAWSKHGKSLLNFKRSDYKAEDMGYVEMGKTNPNIYHLTDLGRELLKANPPEEKQMGEKLMEEQASPEAIVGKWEEIKESDTVREIILTMVNDGDFYRQTIQPWIKNFRRKIKRGAFDITKALEAFEEYAAPAALEKYSIDQAGDPSWGDELDKEDRSVLAKKLLAYYMEEIQELGEQKLMENQEAKLREIIRGLVREVMVSVKEEYTTMADNPAPEEEAEAEQTAAAAAAGEEEEQWKAAGTQNENLEETEEELEEENTFFPTNHDIRSKARMQTNESLMKRWGYVRKEK